MRKTYLRPGRATLFLLVLIGLNLPSSSPQSAAAGPTGENPPVTYGEIGKLLAGDWASGDEFGYSIAVSGDTLVVGAPETKAVYVFERSPGDQGAWIEIAKLSVGDQQSIGLLGYSVDIDGDTIVAGALGEDGDPIIEPGAAYVFERDLGGLDNWGQAARLVSSDAQHYGWFGVSVAIAGDTIVVGAMNEDGGPTDPLSHSGTAYIFERNMGGLGNWGETHKLTASDRQPDHLFGRSLGISTDTIVVGASDDADYIPFNPPPNTGAAYIFERDLGGSGNWGESAILTASDAQEGDEFGGAVGISGDTVVVGADLEDGGPGDPVENAGAAYVFERNLGGAENWGEAVRLAAGNLHDDFFGGSVSIFGDILVVGAPNGSAGTGSLWETGLVHIFERELGGPDSWGEADIVFADDVENGDGFGHTVLAGEEYVAVGVPMKEGASNSYPSVGAVYLFLRMPENAFVPLVEACSLLYYDDFSNPNSGWPVGDTGSTVFAYLNGEYRLLLRNANWFAGAHPGVTLEDAYLVSADMRNISNRAGRYGLIFGHNDWTDFYIFVIDNAMHYEIWKFSNFWTLVTEGTSAALNPGAAINRIAIERVQHEDFTFYANGELLTSMPYSNSLTDRRVGLVAISAAQENLDVRFDDFKVEPLGCGWSTAPPAGRPGDVLSIPGIPNAPGRIDLSLPEMGE